MNTKQSPTPPMSNTEELETRAQKLRLLDELKALKLVDPLTYAQKAAEIYGWKVMSEQELTTVIETTRKETAKKIVGEIYYHIPRWVVKELEKKYLTEGE